MVSCDDPLERAAVRLAVVTSAVLQAPFLLSGTAPAGLELWRDPLRVEMDYSSASESDSFGTSRAASSASPAPAARLQADLSVRLGTVRTISRAVLTLIGPGIRSVHTRPPVALRRPSKDGRGERE